MTRRLAILAALAALGTVPAVAGAHGTSWPVGTSGGTGGAPPARPSSCPATPDPAALATEGELAGDNRVMSDLGPRPTASPEHEQWVAWLAGRLREVPGTEFREVGYGIDRWLEKGASLTAAGSGIRVSGAVPYSQATGGATGDLVDLDAETEITAENARGKVVIRPAHTGSVPSAAFAALEWWSYDPTTELTQGAINDYERDYLAYEQRMADLRAAAKAGAAGLVFVHDFPHEQVRGQYAPYDGERWHVPALYLGIDEGTELRRLARSHAPATLRIAADEQLAPTRTLVATLPGASEERIVIQSHTDGMNAVWDNGPVAMLAMLRHFAAQPVECRPRTLQFVFTTAHLFQQLDPATRGGAAEQVSRELDEDYDKGTVAMTLALEHMGAKAYTAKARGGGRPGREIVPTGINEPTSVFIGESPVLIQSMLTSTIRSGMNATIALRGADLPGLRIPPHRNYGGEGGAYQEKLIPTVALVTGPWSLYNPSFGMEALDFALMRRQLVAFTDLLYSVFETPREVIGGGYLAYREFRSAICSSAFAAFGAADCTRRPPGGAKAPPGTSSSAGSKPVVRCASRRRFAIRLPRRLRSARVTVAGRRVRVRRGRRWTSVVDLRRRPRQTVTVVIRARTRAGRRVTERRRYRLCTRRGA